MLNRKTYGGILAGLLALAVVVGWIIHSGLQDPKLQLFFLDVGQGDAILVQEGNRQLLIDGGKDGRLMLEKLGRSMPFWDRNIEAVIVTHPDQDHIGGLDEVLEKYQIGSFIKNNDRSESQTFKALERLMAGEGAELVEASAGTRVLFPGGTTATVLYPAEPVTEGSMGNTNDHSVVVELEWRGEKFLLTGDLPAAKEEELAARYANSRVKVLKVAHHGSKYSTSDLFLDRIALGQAVISVGAHNMYGHPNPEVLERLKRHNVEVLRTDERGDIIYECKSDPPCLLRR